MFGRNKHTAEWKYAYSTTDAENDIFFFVQSYGNWTNIYLCQQWISPKKFKNVTPALPAVMCTQYNLVTDFVCLLIYEFCLSLCKIAWCSVILLLALFVSELWEIYGFLLIFWFLFTNKTRQPIYN